MATKILCVYENDTYLGELRVSSVRGREQFSFTWDKELDERRRAIVIDPHVMVHRGVYHPLGKDNFGFIEDIMPDRWGRKLIKRKVNGGTLYASDYLIGVDDFTRQGAIRIKQAKNGDFIANDNKEPAPPWTSLRKLEDVARKVDADENIEDEKWLRRLIAPGSSLGGARPKANVVDPEGNLWIAKFPSLKDDWDVGAREYETYKKAVKCGLNVPPAKAQKLSKLGTTFFSQRFDRVGNKRIPYASAMNFCGASDGEDGHSYLDLIEAVVTYSCAPELDLRELYARMIFGELVGNTDNHLRNHGFIRSAKGWRLSPMFDVNPNPDAGSFALESVNDPCYFRLSESEGNAIYAKIKQAINKGC